MTSQAQYDFIKMQHQQKIWIKVYQFFILIGFLGLWELAADLRWIDPFIFSSPMRVITTFLNMLLKGSLLKHIGITLYETLVSFILGGTFGILIAVILWWCERVAKTLEPYLIVLNSLPKTALAPIIIVWLGNTTKSIIFTAISVSIIVTIINVYYGFLQVDVEKIKLIRTFGGHKRDILSKVVIPANYANIISTMKVNIGLSLIGVIIGEFLVAREGLGYLIVYGSQVFKLDWVMMSLIILGILATILYEVILIIERKVQKIGG
ncbi:MAG: sulfonate ABC transporter permease [Firmicutes bacterium HGW-Firmicutes-1]|jgi:NitT/TauT family transport system permease protein|nr:MAG: sulfonate ABC transporter permease [Firmicutes bacterium HGW-Firmicutes-1]